MGRHLRHASPGTGGTKAPLLTTEGEQHLVRAGVTAQPHKAVGEDPTLQGGVNLVLDILGEPFGRGVGVQGSQRGLQMVRDHFIEHRPARIAGFIGGNGKRHESIQGCI